METVIHLIKKHKQLPTLYYMQLICKYSKLAYMEVQDVLTGRAVSQVKFNMIQTSNIVLFQEV